MIIVIFILSNLPGHNPILDLAEKLAQAGNYYEAVTEYKRFIFLSRDSMEIASAWRKIGKLYQNQGMFDEAQNAFKTALVFACNDSFKATLRIDMGINFLAENEISQAELELLRVATFTSFPQLRRHAYFFLGVCYLYKHQWDNALRVFHLAFDSFSVERQLIDSLLNPQKRPRYFFPHLALWLSTFIPGAGQIYSGDWRNGVNAFVVNVATIFLTIHAIANHNIDGALVVYFPLFYRYYLGNRLKAQESAHLHNQTNGKTLAQKILTSLVNFEN